MEFDKRPGVDTQVRATSSEGSRRPDFPARSLGASTGLKRFAVKVLVFLLPFALVFAFPVVTLLLSGELAPVAKIVSAQQEAKGLVLYGAAYSNAALYFKLRATLSRHPDVLVLGTSRVMQIRAPFFKNVGSFYNAGGGIERIKHFRAFLEHIPAGQEPKLLIIGLDQYFFNPNWDNLSGDNIEARLDGADELGAARIVYGSWRKVYGDYLAGKFNFSHLLHTQSGAFGLNAIVNGDGFRNDGSYLYGKFLSHPDDPLAEDYQFRDSLKRIAQGNLRFEPGNEFSHAAVAELDLFLQVCQKRQIHVVAFTPPYAPTIQDKLEGMPERYGYLKEIEPALTQVLARYGFAFFNFTDMRGFGSSDAEALNGLHGSEKTYLRLFLRMVEGDQVLAHYAAEAGVLRARLGASQNNYTVF